MFKPNKSIFLEPNTNEQNLLLTFSTFQQLFTKKKNRLRRQGNSKHFPISNSKGFEPLGRNYSKRVDFQTLFLLGNLSKPNSLFILKWGSSLEPCLCETR